MKFQMGLQKHQIAAVVQTRLIYVGAGTPAFDRSLYSMAGYTNFDVMLVGAAGGVSGAAIGTSSGDVKMNKCGGGGGGALRLAGKLADLPRVSPMSIGSPGTPGADGALRAKAGDGTPGGSASFNGYVAYGGGGGIGGDWDSADPYIAAAIVGKGGAGGGNSAGLGSGGAGAVQSQAQIYNGSGLGADIPGSGGSDATPGVYVAGGTYPVIGGSHGGGGGKGQVTSPHTVWPPSSGADGGTTQVTGPGDATAFNIGGTGGGATVTVITGGNPYDTLGSGITSPGDQGGVAIHIS